MNTNVNAKRVLCFGDSNTWGKIPGSKTERYPLSVRWTGILQEQLGTAYEIIEEGLNSRTIDLDDPDQSKPMRNGLKLFMPILETHNPIDVLIIMLGTNDMKTKYNRSAEQIGKGMEQLIQKVDAFCANVALPKPKIILISPPIVKEVRPELYAGAKEKSEKLAQLYEPMSQRVENCSFIDAAILVESSDVDGVHWNSAGHQKLAEAIFEHGFK